MTRFVVSTFLCGMLLMGCAGYRLGSIGGKNLQGVHTVSVPVVKNESLEPSIQVMTTNAILRAFDNDGTLKTVQGVDADSELTVIVKSLSRENIRGNLLDPQAAEEYEITLHAEVTFLNRRLGKKVLDAVVVNGTTKYFVQSNQAEAERQAVPMASEDLAKNIVSLVTEGW